MKNSTGIIAEYNPFHNGHAYHLSRARAVTGCSHTIVAMSGSFVQRGDVAAFDKFSRARAALAHGADIVLELPTAFACASAERFAHGGVALLAATGLVSTLAFGTEHTDLTLLSGIAFPAEGEDSQFSENISFHLKRGLSFPAARAAALADSCDAAVLSAPNNILAVEYLKAIHALAPGMTPVCIERIGAAHDAPGQGTEAGFASGSALRDATERCDIPFIRGNTPADVAKEIEAAIASLTVPQSANSLSDAILYALRKLSRAGLAELPDVGEGLENLLYEKARECTNYPEFLATTKTKRYTMARLRRIAMYALLGVDKAFFARHAAPRYLRVLGVRREALPLLSALTEAATLPVVTSHSDYAALDASAKEMFDLDLFAGELQPMASPAPCPVENEFARPLLIV